MPQPATTGKGAGRHSLVRLALLGDNADNGVMLAPPKARPIKSLSVEGRPILLANWLFVVAVLVVAMVVVGGITRLTESGLSITEWKPLSGALPPLSHADWLHEFALYQSTTQYQTVNRGMTLGDFQFIYFWEWSHRLLARLVGTAFAVPLAWFAWRRTIPSGFGWRLLGLLGLGAMQGVVGWWMVVSGLVGRTEVSHYRLAVHLCLALTILAATVWTARDLIALDRHPAARPAKLTRGVGIALALLFVQLVWGAFTAGLRAGYAYPTWPTMGGEWFPSGVPMALPMISNAIDNAVVVQFIHRWGAFVVAGALIWLGVQAMRNAAPRAGRVLHLLVLVQISLGIATLMTGVELWVAVAHQASAALIVATAAWCGQAVGARRQGLHPAPTGD